MPDYDRIYISPFYNKKIDLKYDDGQLSKIQKLKNSQRVKEKVVCEGSTIGRHGHRNQTIQCVEKDSGVDSEYLDCKNLYMKKDRCAVRVGYHYFRLYQLNLRDDQIKILKNFSKKIFKILALYLFLFIIINFCFTRYYL